MEGVYYKLLLHIIRQFQCALSKVKQPKLGFHFHMTPNALTIRSPLPSPHLLLGVHGQMWSVSGEDPSASSRPQTPSWGWSTTGGTVGLGTCGRRRCSSFSRRWAPSTSSAPGPGSWCSVGTWSTPCQVTRTHKHKRTHAQSHTCTHMHA
jgi:hypothetical protein